MVTFRGKDGRGPLRGLRDTNDCHKRLALAHRFASPRSRLRYCRKCIINRHTLQEAPQAAVFKVENRHANGLTADRQTFCLDRARREALSIRVEGRIGRLGRSNVRVGIKQKLNAIYGTSTMAARGFSHDRHNCFSN